MTSTLGSRNSRQALVLPTILGFHVAIFWLVASGLAPRLFESLTKDPPPVTILPREEERIVIAKPGPTAPVEIEYAQVVKPVVKIPEFTENAPTVPVPRDKWATGDGAAVPAAEEFVPPGLRTRDRRLATLVEACYPAASRRLGEEGRAVAHVTIGADGRPRNWRVARSSGYPRLDAATGCVIERLEFEAGRLGGRAVEAEAALPIVFQLK